MATSAKASNRLASENLRVKAQVVQLTDRLDRLTAGVCVGVVPTSRNKSAIGRKRAPECDGRCI